MKHFELRVAYHQFDERGKAIQVREKFLLSGSSSFDVAYAEALSLLDRMELSIDCISGIKSVDLDIHHNQSPGKWYVVRLKLVDENSSQKVKSTKEKLLVRCENPEKAIEYVYNVYKQTIFLCEVIDVKESGITDVIILDTDESETD